MNGLKEVVVGMLFIVSLILIAYSRIEYLHAMQQRVAACQMLPDRKLWDDFGCSKAFKEAQR